MSQHDYRSRSRSQSQLDSAEHRAHRLEQAELFGTLELPSQKRAVREEIRVQTRIFLAKGGCITLLPPGPEPHRRSTGLIDGYIDPASEWLLGSFTDIEPINPKQEKAK